MLIFDLRWSLLTSSTSVTVHRSSVTAILLGTLSENNIRLAPCDRSDIGGGGAHSREPSKFAACTSPQSTLLSTQIVALHLMGVVFPRDASSSLAAVAVSPPSTSAASSSSSSSTSFSFSDAALSGASSSSDRQLRRSWGEGGGGVRYRAGLRSRLGPPLRHACQLACGGPS